MLGFTTYCLLTGFGYLGAEFTALVYDVAGAAIGSVMVLVHLISLEKKEEK